MFFFDMHTVCVCVGAHLSGVCGSSPTASRSWRGFTTAVLCASCGYTTTGSPRRPACSLLFTCRCDGGICFGVVAAVVLVVGGGGGSGSWAVVFVVEHSWWFVLRWVIGEGVRKLDSTR